MGKELSQNYLLNKINFFQLSTGDLLRVASTDVKSEVGKKIKKIMESGELVPDDFVIDIIVKKVSDLKHENIIFDGFPRNIEQAKFLDESLKEVNLSRLCYIF